MFGKNVTTEGYLVFRTTNVSSEDFNVIFVNVQFFNLSPFLAKTSTINYAVNHFSSMSLNKQTYILQGSCLIGIGLLGFILSATVIYCLLFNVIQLPGTKVGSCS